MHQLIPLERALFAAILILSVMSAGAAYMQVARDNLRLGNLTRVLTSILVTLATGLLISRAVVIQEFPITGVFESMLILIVFMGLTFLMFSVFMQQIWFLAVMSWVLLLLVLLSATVARPVGILQDEARTPWVIVHALAMAMSGAMIVFAAAMSILFLWSRKCLKSPRFSTLFGRMPSVENLERFNLAGLRLSFIFLTFGLVSGVGLVAVKSAGLGMTPGDWLTDSKIVMIGIGWVVLLGTLVLRKGLAFGGKAVAWATLVICFCILFAFIGSQLWCKSSHDFSTEPATSTRQVQ
jgi:ABC-type uncharacterized transport system permease subunit